MRGKKVQAVKGTMFWSWPGPAHPNYPPVPHRTLEDAVRTAQMYGGRVEYHGKVVWPEPSMPSSSIHGLSIDQRVNTPLGPGRVTMSKGKHVGVQLDTGEYAHVEASQVTPTGERQRFINGTPDEHEQQANFWAPDAQAHLAEAAMNARAGRCDAAVRALTQGLEEFGMVRANIQGAGADFNENFPALRRAKESVTQTFAQKCLRKK